MRVLSMLLVVMAASLLNGCFLLFSPLDPTTNRAPVVSPVSLQTNGTLPYLEQVLPGSDPDGDAITFELRSPQSGTGYQQAILVPLTGRLYVTLREGFLGAISLRYRATDGLLFSPEATVTIQVTNQPQDNNGLGSEDVDPREYAGFDVEYYDPVMQADGTETRVPRRVDLSSLFPIPGNQGSIGSCVGWSVAYALKTYQERLETGWDLNSPARVFSPSYVFSQIALPGCNGSYISQALDLLVAQGCSTWQAMPYVEVCGGSPSAAARAEAANFKASRWYRLNSVQQAKDALTNRQPIVIGIPIYQNYYNLSGPNAVYNTMSGRDDGGHAVCITGFDDDRFGGAFRVINSWGTNWGDNGYFWLPYDFAGRVISQMYVLVDANNQGQPIDPGLVITPPENLPNLQIAEWEAQYDEQPGGAGLLTYRVVNSGTGTAPAGFDVNLMLSTDRDINANDVYLIWEEVPFTLAPGEYAYRDNANPISFQFPTSLPNGTYYMAMWVDDMQEVQESNENDNVSFATNTVTLQSNLPDLVVDGWFAEWDDFGDGFLEYIIRNQGTATVPLADWDINLILLNAYEGEDWFLVHEFAGRALAPGQALIRTGNNATPFNVVTQFNGAFVTPGIYYMVLWVDLLEQVVESNENNNVSFSQGAIEVVAGKQAGEVRVVDPGTAYNGRMLPGAQMQVQEVEVTRDKEGKTVLRPILKDVDAENAREALGIYEKINASQDRVVFPVAAEHRM